VGFMVEEVLPDFDPVTLGAAWRLVAVSAGARFGFGISGRGLETR